VPSPRNKEYLDGIQLIQDYSITNFLVYILVIYSGADLDCAVFELQPVGAASEVVHRRLNFRIGVGVFKDKLKDTKTRF